jgi:polyisoprenoid-binding protein YceI
MTMNATQNIQDRKPFVRTWTIDPAHTTVGFSAKHMMFTTVRGRFNQLAGQVTLDPTRPEGGLVEVELDAASIDTGVEQRDGHLRSADFLDTEAHPRITFRSRKVEGGALRDGGRYKLSGDLTIRGVTHEVHLDVRYDGKGKDPWGSERMGFTASGSFDRRDFGLTWNQVLEAGGVLVSNEVKIEIEVQVKEAADRQAA